MQQASKLKHQAHIPVASRLVSCIAIGMHLSIRDALSNMPELGLQVFEILKRFPISLCAFQCMLQLKIEQVGLHETQSASLKHSHLCCLV